MGSLLKFVLSTLFRTLIIYFIRGHSVFPYLDILRENYNRLYYQYNLALQIQPDERW